MLIAVSYTFEKKAHNLKFILEYIYYNYGMLYGNGSQIDLSWVHFAHA